MNSPLSNALDLKPGMAGGRTTRRESFVGEAGKALGALGSVGCGNAAMMRSSASARSR